MHYTIYLLLAVPWPLKSWRSSIWNPPKPGVRRAASTSSRWQMADSAHGIQMPAVQRPEMVAPTFRDRHIAAQLVAQCHHRERGMVAIGLEYQFPLADEVRRAYGGRAAISFQFRQRFIRLFRRPVVLVAGCRDLALVREFDLEVDPELDGHRLLRASDRGTDHGNGTAPPAAAWHCQPGW